MRLRWRLFRLLDSTQHRLFPGIDWSWICDKWEEQNP
jgi:hypothetical protein